MTTTVNEYGALPLGARQSAHCVPELQREPAGPRASWIAQPDETRASMNRAVEVSVTVRLSDVGAVELGDAGGVEWVGDGGALLLAGGGSGRAELVLWLEGGEDRGVGVRVVGDGEAGGGELVCRECARARVDGAGAGGGAARDELGGGLDGAGRDGVGLDALGWRVCGDELDGCEAGGTGAAWAADGSFGCTTAARESCWLALSPAVSAKATSAAASIDAAAPALAVTVAVLPRGRRRPSHSRPAAWVAPPAARYFPASAAPPSTTGTTAACIAWLTSAR